MSLCRTLGGELESCMSSVTLRWLSKKCKVANKQGNEAKPGLTRKNENPARACDVERAPARAGSREPSWCGRYEGLCYEGSASQTQGRAKGSSRNVWFEPNTVGCVCHLAADEQAAGSWRAGQKSIGVAHNSAWR